jgi:hypothetical protein
MSRNVKQHQSEDPRVVFRRAFAQISTFKFCHNDNDLHPPLQLITYHISLTRKR